MKKHKLVALKNAKTNKWIKIGVEGEWEGHENGKFKLNNKLFEEMLKNFKKAKVDLVVDYEHSTLYEPKAPAGGWITQEPLNLKVEENALWVKIDWTKQAKAHIEAKEYKYLSPVFIFNTKSRSTGENIGATLHSVALTNTPFLEELGAIANKQKDNTMAKELQAQLDEANNKLANKDVKIQELEAQIAELKKGAEEQKATAAKAKVAVALSTGKLAKNQEAWALSYAVQDEEGFDAFIKNAPVTQDFSGEIFANSDQKKKGKEEPISMSKV